jgi:hypothetical protein
MKRQHWHRRRKELGLKATNQMMTGHRPFHTCKKSYQRLEGTKKQTTVVSRTPDEGKWSPNFSDPFKSSTS